MNRIVFIIQLGSAWAIQLATSTTFEDEQPKHVLFYDHGASSLQLLLTSMRQVDKSKKSEKKSGKKSEIQIVNHATAWDTEIGGRELDRR